MNPSSELNMRLKSFLNGIVANEEDDLISDIVSEEHKNGDHAYCLKLRRSQEVSVHINYQGGDEFDKQADELAETMEYKPDLSVTQPERDMIRNNVNKTTKEK